MTAGIDEFLGYGVRGITVYKGSSCSVLSCFASSPLSFGIFAENDEKNLRFDFFADAGQTYYVAMQLNEVRNFTAKFDGKLNFFSIYDSSTDLFLQGLRDFNYSNIPLTSPNLNIRATFGEPSNNSTIIRSVRMMYDNQRRACEKVLPYSVFGDTNGNYNNATIQLGTHTVVATPYATSNCTGPTGTPLRQCFNVVGCTLDYELSSSYNVFPPNECFVNVGVKISCRYSYLQNLGNVRMQLRNTATNKVVTEQTVPVDSGSYFLNLYDPYINIPSGSYSVTVFVDNIKHPSKNFTIANCTTTV